MELYARHQMIWGILYALLSGPVCRTFRLTHEDLHVDGPVLLIPNHVTPIDPLLVAMSLKAKQVYFVASEHIFRWGLVTKLLNWAVAPIPRRKGSSGTDTVRACLRHLKAGHSVCIFAEGEVCWDGRSRKVFPATGKLAKLSGATLVTYRLEGGHLTRPRWAKNLRPGKMHGHPVNIYSPEKLKTMSAEEIDAAIDRDIYEDAWQRQRQHMIAYKGKHPAEGLQKALYLCPGCGSVGTLRTKKDRLFCSCGLNLRYTETGFFDPQTPFATVADWEDWQKAKLRARDFPHGELLFSDEDISLTKVGTGHSEQALGAGRLELYEDRLCCAGHSFPLSAVNNMAPVLSNLLLFSYEGDYYQLRSDKGANLRKYLEIWSDERA